MRSNYTLCLLGACTLSCGFFVGYHFNEIGVKVATLVCTLMVASVSAMFYIFTTSVIDRLPRAESLDLRQLYKSVDLHTAEGFTSLVPQDHCRKALAMRILITMSDDGVCVVARQPWNTKNAVRVITIRPYQGEFYAEKRLRSCSDAYVVTPDLPPKTRLRDKWWRDTPVTPGEVAALIEAVGTDWQARTCITSR